MEREPRRLVAGRYQLVARLGTGAMGTVWRAEDVLLGRPVAVKEVVFPPGTRPDDAEVLRERTRREARAAARLDHPSAVTVFDVVEEDGRPWLVLELVEARSLAEVVAEDGALPPARVAQIGLALLGALETAHAAGIVHRDVKPGNVLLARSGRVVLTDFGIATSTGDASLTSTGLLLGSPAYIAPERARGQAPGPPSDLWSLGATLFTAVEGRPPYDEGGDPLRTVTAVVTGAHAPYVHAGALAPVLDGLLEKDPAARLDAPAARAGLQRVVTAPAVAPDPPTRLLAAVATPLPASDLPASDATAALQLGEVREEVAAVRARRSRRPGLVGGLAAVALAAAVAGAVQLRGDPPAPAAAPAGPSASPTPRAARAAVPAGWTTYTDPAGWSVSVPADWERSDRGEQVQFRDEAHRRTLRITSTEQPSGTALQAWQRTSPAFAAALDEYRQLRLEPVDVAGTDVAGTDVAGMDVADLEFTYTSQATRLRVLDRRFVSGGTAQSLYWQTGVDDFAESLPVFEQVAAGFRPPPRPAERHLRAAARWAGSQCPACP